MDSTQSKDSSSVFSMGGGGNVFEVKIQTAFVTTLLVRGRMPGFSTAEVVEVAFQTTRLGYRTDDVLVKLRSHRGEQRMLAQIKHELTISAKNEKFEEVITALWQDFNNPSAFNPSLDRLLIIKSALTQTDRQDTVTLLDWAKSKASANDFYLEVDRIEKKKKALAVLAEVLQKANDGIVVDKERLWQFLRCLVLLEYDFGKESSNSETNYLNLIELAKSQKTTLSAKEIWDSIESHVARLNKDGGSISLESIQIESFATHFDSSRLFDSYVSIKKIQDDSEVILGPLKSTIADFHISRPELNEKLGTLLDTQKLTIVTGEPGVGKSALVKEIVSSLSSDTAVLVFKADQFNQPHLSKVFTNLGISDCLKDLSACLAAIPKKLIVIDSFEKLLEGDPDNAFRQLMYLLEGVADVCIVATSRIYAVELLTQKYALNNVSVLEVPLLTEGEDGEFEKVLTTFPKLRLLASNSQLRQVLRSPKYLDFALQWLNNTSQDIGELTLTEFKNKLWQHIVENNTVIHNGMPNKRRKAFMEIALRRAQRMTLYAEPVDADSEAIDELLNDNVLTKQADEYRFAPSHDILEDWALVKYIHQMRETHAEPNLFYQHIGNKPALRRAFRLWVEESLRYQAGSVFELVRETQLEANIERYWADEVLIAILRSDQSISFFEEFGNELLQDHAQFLQRTIHLLRTACREHGVNGSITLLFPVGAGWGATLAFIQKHLDQLETLRPLIVGLLVDWGLCLYKYPRNLSLSEIEPAKKILFLYLNEIENRVDVWKEEPLSNRVTELIEITFKFSEFAPNDVKEILERAIPKVGDRYNYRDTSFYGHIRKMALLGIYSHPLTKFLPEQVTAMAKAIWIKKPYVQESKHIHPFQRAYEENEDDGYSFDKDKTFGLENNSDYSPSGIYKTPVYNLLKNNWQLGADFLLEMVNYCTKHYVKSRKGENDGVVEVELQLLGGQSVKQYGSATLWQAYRGTVVSSYLLESLLMSLEKYLLEIAEKDSEFSKENIELLFDYLLYRSNSVAISSVLVSISIAFPEIVGKSMLPLLGVREFYEWDMNRSFQDLTDSFVPIDYEISWAQKERIISNQLPHRKKYISGLRDFVVDLQLNSGVFNQFLFESFDRMWSEADKQDIIWRKTLHEIDSRKWQITDVSPEEGILAVKPKYASDVQQMVDGYQPRRDFTQQVAVSNAWIRDVYEQKEENKADYDRWKEIYKRFQIEDNIDPILDQPVTLAVLGLGQLSEALSPQQRIWCIETVTKAIETLILGAKHKDQNVNTWLTISHFDREAALQSFPLLLKSTIDEAEQKIIVKLIFQALTTYFYDHEMKLIVKSLREKLWEINDELADRIWFSLIQFAQIRQTNEKTQLRSFHDEKLREQIEQSEEDFINQLVSAIESKEVDFHQIDLGTWHSHLLLRAITILPHNTQDEQHMAYRDHFVSLFLKGLDKSSDERFGRNPLTYPEDQSILQKHLRDFFLYCDYDNSEGIFELLLRRALHILETRSYYNDEGFEFVKYTLEMVVYELDRVVYNSNELIGKQATINFWRIWEKFYQILYKSEKRLFMGLFFLDIGWKEDSNHFLPLNGKKSFFKKVTHTFAKYDVKPLIKLLSTIGDQTLMPEGLHWLVDVLKKHPENIAALLFNESEVLITRLYQRHISVIKNNSSLLDDFIWLLDKMVDLGSSRAYITRENLITYK